MNVWCVRNYYSGTDTIPRMSVFPLLHNLAVEYNVAAFSKLSFAVRWQYYQ